MSLDRYLRDVGEQDAREMREMHVGRSPALDAVLAAYERWLESIPRGNTSGHYSHAVSCAEHLVYDAADVRDFSVVLPWYEEEPYFSLSGLFLSALVNSGPDQEYELVTEHLDTRLHDVGWQNRKRLTVRGDVGELLATDMYGGTLTVKGNAGHFVGHGMSDGVLRVDGEIASVSGLWRGGSIYHEGKLLRGEP